MLVALPVLRCFRGATWRAARTRWRRCVAVGAAILVGAHALVDFSLQIQAVALTVAALLGAGLAQAESSRVSLDDGSGRSGPAGPIRDAAPRRHARAFGRRRLTALAVSALCGYAAWQGGDLALSAARAPGADETRPGRIRRHARNGGRGGAALARHSRARAARPSIFRWRKSPRSTPETGQRQAAELTALVAARPLSSQAWLSLAVFRLVARDELASVLAALRLSWLTGPNEGSVLWRRGVFGLALWEFLPADARDTDHSRPWRAQCASGLVADRQALGGDAA